MGDGRSGVQSVGRAIAVLRALEAEAVGLGISEVARRTGLTVSTAHRLARALCDAGLASQDLATERYRLGPALVTLGQRAERALGYDRLRPLMANLVELTGESANLGILAGGEVLVVLSLSSPQPLRFEQRAGATVPAHTSAMGKALLAHAPDPVAAVQALGTLRRYTDRTITDRDALLAELSATRERCWSLNDGERDPGVRAIGAPVLGTDRTAVAAIAVQGPALRLDDVRLVGLSEQVVSAAAQAAQLIVGHRDGP
jgi:IclR family transcriptional regulator, acetate operon repressor